MVMVKVFKTDVEAAGEADNMIRDLLRKYPFLKINFDLEDEDRILRVEGTFFEIDDVIHCLKKNDHCCVYLPMDFDQ